MMSWCCCDVGDINPGVLAKRIGINLQKDEWLWADIPGEGWRLLKLVITSKDSPCKLIDTDDNLHLIPYDEVVKLSKADFSLLPSTLDLNLVLDSHDGALVHHLRDMYTKEISYTHARDLLICLDTGTSQPESNGMPHINVLTRKVLDDLNYSSRNQTMLFLGKSSSGKSNSFKLALQQLSDKCPGSPFLQVIPILEAFCEAGCKTSKSTSKFVVSVKVGASATNGACVSIIGSALEMVPCPPKGEYNFNIFYQLLAGASQSTKDRFSLRGVKDFRCLRGSEERLGLNDADAYSATCRALSTFGFTPDAMDCVVRALASILFICNICFEGEEISNIDMLHHAANVLDVEDVSLAKCLNSPTARDQLASSLYSNLVDYIIECVNTVLASNMEGCLSISLVNVPGFSTGHNGLDSLQMNYANELFHHFVAQNVLHSQDEVIDPSMAACESIEMLFKAFSDPSGDMEELRNRKNMEFAPEASEIAINHYCGKSTYNFEGTEFQHAFSTEASTMLPDSKCSMLINSNLEKPHTSELLRSLLNEVRMTQNHVVHCISPSQVGNKFSGEYVYDQLIQSSLIPYIRDHSPLFHYSKSMGDFYRRYRVITEFGGTRNTPRNLWGNVLYTMAVHFKAGIEFDGDCVRLTYHTLQALEKHRHESTVPLIVKLQIASRSILARNRFKRIVSSVVHLKDATKGTSIPDLESAIKLLESAPQATLDNAKARLRLLKAEALVVSQIDEGIVTSNIDALEGALAIIGSHKLAMSGSENVHVYLQKAKDAIETLDVPAEAPGTSPEDFTYNTELLQDLDRAMEAVDVVKMRNLLSIARKRSIEGELVTLARNLSYGVTPEELRSHRFALALEQESSPMLRELIHEAESSLENFQDVVEARMYLLHIRVNHDFEFNERAFPYDLTEQLKYLTGLHSLREHPQLRPMYFNNLKWQSDVIMEPMIYPHYLQIRDHILPARIFKALQAILQDSYHVAPFELASFILDVGFGKPHLRDEIYAQIIKQTTEHPHIANEFYGWKLLYLCLNTFPTQTEEMSTILLSHIAAASSFTIESKVHFDTLENVATHCLLALVRIMNGDSAPKAVPPMNEIVSFMSPRSFTLHVDVVGDNSFKFPLTTSNEALTVSGVERLIMCELGLPGTGRLVVSQYAPQPDEYDTYELVDTDTVLECFSFWTHQARMHPNLEFEFMFYKNSDSTSTVEELEDSGEDSDFFNPVTPGEGSTPPPEDSIAVAAKELAKAFSGSTASYRSEVDVNDSPVKSVPQYSVVEGASDIVSNETGEVTTATTPDSVRASSDISTVDARPESPIETSSESAFESRAFDSATEPTVELATIERSDGSTVKPIVEPTIDSAAEAPVELTNEATVESMAKPDVEPTVEPDMLPIVDLKPIPDIELAIEPSIHQTVEDELVDVQGDSTEEQKALESNHDETHSVTRIESTAPSPSAFDSDEIADTPLDNGVTVAESPIAKEQSPTTVDVVQPVEEAKDESKDDNESISITVLDVSSTSAERLAQPVPKRSKMLQRNQSSSRLHFKGVESDGPISKPRRVRELKSRRSAAESELPASTPLSEKNSKATPSFARIPSLAVDQAPKFQSSSRSSIAGDELSTVKSAFAKARAAAVRSSMRDNDSSKEHKPKSAFALAREKAMKMDSEEKLKSSKAPKSAFAKARELAEESSLKSVAVTAPEVPRDATTKSAFAKAREAAAAANRKSSRSRKVSVSPDSKPTSPVKSSFAKAREIAAEAERASTKPIKSTSGKFKKAVSEKEAADELAVRLSERRAKSDKE